MYDTHNKNKKINYFFEKEKKKKEKLVMERKRVELL